MHKNDYLFAHFQNSHKVVENDVVHNVVTALGVAHFFDAVEGTLQRCWPVGAVESKCALSVSPNEISNICVVGQCG